MSNGGRHIEIPMKRVFLDASTASNIGMTNWVPLVSNMVDDTYSAEFFNSTGSLMELGIGANTAAVTAIQYYLIPGGPAGQIGLLVNKSQNVFIRAVDVAATAGLVVANFLR